MKFSTYLLAATLSIASLGALAHADNEQSAGGWGLNCNSGNFVCDSGRTIYCNAYNVNSSQESECTQNTGSVGWVRCTIYDQFGHVIDQSTDQCP